MTSNSPLEAAVTGWHLLSGEAQGESDAQRIVTDAATTSGRQRTARRFAVGRRMNRCGHPPDARSHAGGMATCSWLGASSTSSGQTSPAFGPLLPSRLLRSITTTSNGEFEV